MTDKIEDGIRYERLMDRYRNGDVDRRTFLGLVGAAAVSTGLAGGFLSGMSRQAIAQVQEVRFDGWGGVVQDALRKLAFEPFTKESNIKVVEGSFGGEDEIYTKVKASNTGEYHIVESAGVEWYKRWVDAGLCEKLNETNIPNIQTLMPALIAPFRAVTPDALCGIPYHYGVTGIAYNTKYVSKEEAESLGAKLLLKKELKGKVTGWADWETRVWYGALMSDQDPNNIQDIDAVWAKVREHRDNVKKYWNSAAESMDLLASEEVYVAEAFSGRVALLQQQGYPIAYMDPPNSFGWIIDFLVLKGSPVEACETLINFMLDPATQITVAEAQLYPPGLDASKYEIPEAVKQFLTFDPTGTLKGITFADAKYWNDNQTEWQKIWNRIQRGG
ncbi:MAG: ABC transporter substrate-binding protein [Mesorhizobium sp.]